MVEAGEPWKHLLKWLNLLKQKVFLFTSLVMLGRVNQYQVLFSKRTSGVLWSKPWKHLLTWLNLLKHLALRPCYDVTWDSANGKTQDKSVFQSFLCHMTCNSQLEVGEKLINSETQRFSRLRRFLLHRSGNLEKSGIPYVILISCYILTWLTSILLGVVQVAYTTPLAPMVGYYLPPKICLK